MKYLRIPLVLVWKLWFIIVAIFCTLSVGTIIYILSYQKNNRLTYFFMRLWAYILFYGSGFTYSLQYSEKLDPKENYILISNHTSAMDVALMYILHPNHPIVFVGKKELEKYPIFGRIYKKVSIIVDRSDKKSREAVFPLVKKTLKEDKNVVLFPEGGVPNRNIILGNFKDGPFVTATYCNKPIVVYVFHNLKNMFPFVNILGYPGKVRTERLAILHPKDFDNKDLLKQKAYELIYNKIKSDPINHPQIK